MEFINKSLRTVVIGGLVVGLLGPMGFGTWYVLKTQKEKLLQDAAAAHQRATNVLALGASPKPFGIFLLKRLLLLLSLY
ncbi:MAG: hypothetical protein KBD78_04210 [Oligoflexales bacterium]|nr:hypothetical protein [Oligoflexales bacterium]